MSSHHNSNVYRYFVDLFPEYSQEIIEETRAEEWLEFELHTVCGVRCVEIMHRAQSLMSICDSSCHHSIIEGVVDAMRVVCFG